MRKNTLLQGARWGLSPAMARELSGAELGNQSGGFSTKSTPGPRPPHAPAAPANGAFADATAAARGDAAPTASADATAAARGDAAPTASADVDLAARGDAAPTASADITSAAGGPTARPAAPLCATAHRRANGKAASTVPCPCELCRHQPGHPDEEHHRDLRSLLRQLGEPQRRWVAALEARRLGFGGTRLVARITGLDEKTVRRGRRELGTAFADVPSRRLRRPATRRAPEALPAAASSAKASGG